MKSIKNDCKGYILSGISGILLISFFIIVILLLSVIYYINTDNSQGIASDNIKYIVEDYSQNIEILAYRSLEEESNNVINSKNPLFNAPDKIKDNLNKKLNLKNKEYYDNYNINITSEVISIENHDTPEFLKIKTVLIIEFGENKFNKIVESKTSILNLKDPLPVILCGKHPNFHYNDTTILYEDSLVDYLIKRNVINSEGYLNATSPFIMKKCPYDPYIHHGDNDTLNNCILNGYYHESSDGSCYLCRLEGKVSCPHYGFETFIIPDTNLTSSVSSSDHVVFYENYPGTPYIFNNLSDFLFLDNSHRAKYGL
ncbi:hypothetical protein LJB96_04265 [Methanobrevibacter sp. OttesenSCG-928-K11]|nr:hypothetical protein [Methanobrevibacter sp. OttesenSCG-928-K11]MDL2270372.1 hypothetical protein [Methanobrevibacter sp. OttesenSCG-928-I08]